MSEGKKLSTCIREGAAIRPQAFGDYISHIPLEEGRWICEDRTCALGAAYEAITGKLPDPDWMQDGEVNKTIFKACGVRGIRIPYPQNTFPGKEAYVVDMVISLNDTFKWTREQIAEYLERIGY